MRRYTDAPLCITLGAVLAVALGVGTWAYAGGCAAGAGLCAFYFWRESRP